MLERVLLYTEVFVGRKPEIQRKKVKKAMHLRDTRSAVLSDRHFILSSRKTKGMGGGEWDVGVEPGVMHQQMSGFMVSKDKQKISISVRKRNYTPDAGKSSNHIKTLRVILISMA